MPSASATVPSLTEYAYVPIEAEAAAVGMLKGPTLSVPVHRVSTAPPASLFVDLAHVPHF